MVLPANRNIDVMKAYSRRASDMLVNGIILGANTDKITLNAEERRRHESELEKMAHKSVLLRKSEEAWEKLEDDDEGVTILAVDKTTKGL